MFKVNKVQLMCCLSRMALTFGTLDVQSLQKKMQNPMYESSTTRLQNSITSL